MTENEAIETIAQHMLYEVAESAVHDLMWEDYEDLTESHFRAAQNRAQELAIALPRPTGEQFTQANELLAAFAADED